MIELREPLNGARVNLQTEDQKEFLLDEARRAQVDGALTFQWYDLEKQGMERTSPLPVTFVWEEVTPDGGPVEGAYYYLLVSESEDMSGAWTYATSDTRYDVYNLKVGAEYFWCVRKNGKQSEVFSFETNLQPPRCLKVDKVWNMRDLGGYLVAEGQIRQGLVYRGGELDTHMHLEPSGALELLRLGMRTEIDLRGEAVGNIDWTPAECVGIRRYLIPSVPYYRVFDREQRTAVKNFFKLFADQKNYPIYFHCWGGADRTGTYAFILGAFLGMRYEDLINEYEFTSLSVWGTRTRNFSEFQDFLKLFSALPGETLRDKATAFLKKHAGMTDKQLERIYDFLVDKK